MKKIKIVGNILTLLALVFIANKIMHIEIDTNLLLNGNNLFIIGVVFLIYSFCVYALSFPLKKLIDIFELKDINLFEFSRIYLKSNVMKYIPGNIFQYIGRNELANKFGYKYSSINFASILEIALIVFVSAIMSVCISARDTYNFLVSYGIIRLVILAIAAAIISVIIYIKSSKFKNCVKLIWKHINNKQSLSNIVLSILFYSVNLFIQGILFCAILFICEQNSSMEVISVIGAFIISWLIGYLTPGSPGGIGVREAVMISILNTSTISSDSILMTLVIIRIINVFGDLFAFLVSNLPIKLIRGQV